jgi:hypothetical protein
MSTPDLATRIAKLLRDSQGGATVVDEHGSVLTAVAELEVRAKRQCPKCGASRDKN